MLGYNLLFLTSLIWVLSSKNFSFNIKVFLYSLLIISLSIFIGLRHEVGGDWNNYKLSYSYIIDQNLVDFLYSKRNINEIGFKFLIFISSKISIDYCFHIANLTCAVIFVTSFIFFISNFPYRSILFFFAIPYLIIVVSMGYTRQSAAIGFLFLSLLYLNKNQNYKSFILILLGSLFHKTVIFTLLILVIRNLKINKLKSYFLPLFILFIFMTFYFSMLRQLIVNFLNVDAIETFGAKLRLFINFSFSIFYLLIRKNWDNNFFDKKIIDICSFLMIVFFITSFFVEGPIISALDRLSIYLYLVNLIIISNFFYRLKSNGFMVFCCFSIIILSYLYFLFWITFGDYSHFWLPYKNIIIK